MNRYEIIIDTDDARATTAARSLFTDVRIEPLFESPSHSVVTFAATDDALTAYADTFSIPADERDELFDALD